MYDESESEPLTQPDTTNQTKFHADDPEAGFDGKYRLDGTATFEQHYSRLARQNVGVFNGKWADESKRVGQDKLAVFDAICTQLDLTDYQKECGRREFEQLDVQDLSSPSVDLPLVAIMVSAVVVRRDGRQYHPLATRINNDGLFLALLDELGYSDETLHSAFGKVQNRLEDRP